MGFTIDKKQFLRALTSVMPAVSTRTTLPILSGVKLIGADTRYSLQTTDLELVISMQGPAQGSGKIGEAVVPAKALVKAVKSMPESEVAIDFADPDSRSVVEVSSGSRRIAIEALPVGDWPEVLKDIKAEAVCWFEPAEMAEALEKMVLCASADEARPVLTGVQFNFGGDGIELAATDSYRLGVLSIEVEQMGEVPDFTPVVPARVLKALAKQLKKHDGRGILYVGASGSGEEDSRRPIVEFSFGSFSHWGNSPSIALVARCDSGQVDAPCGELDEEQDVQGLQGDRLHREEVRGEDALGLSSQELRPARAGAPWRWAEAGLAKQPPDGRRADADAELSELALNPDVAPPGVLPRQAKDEVAELRIDGRRP